MTVHHRNTDTADATNLQRREFAESIKNPRAQIERAMFEAYRQVLKNYRKHLQT